MRSSLALSLPVAALLAAGCGSAPQSAADQPQLATTLQRDRSPGQAAGAPGAASPGSGSLIFVMSAHGGPPRPPRELYAVFRRPPRSSDLEAQQRARDDALLDTVGAPDALGASIGGPLYEDARLVLGSGSRGIYALPTTRGAVCVGAFPDGGAGCGTPGPHGLSVEYDDSLGLRLYGLVADDVRGVDVVVGGVTRQAELGENGYRLKLADAGWGQLHALRLHLRNGATERIPLQP